MESILTNHTVCVKVIHLKSNIVKNKTVDNIMARLSPERRAEIKREILEDLAFNRQLEEQGYVYNTDKSYSLKLLNDAGHFPIGITTMMGEETFIFKTETEANEAWNSHVLGYDGWFYGEYSFKLAQEEYEKELDFKLNIYWL